MTPDEHRAAALGIIRRRAENSDALAIADYCYHFGLNAADEDREAIADLIHTANIEITFGPKPHVVIYPNCPTCKANGWNPL
jgi:hypothetical protein